ncbi:MAG TPA: potassium-transporting ATPase subunit KdpC [Chroococcales cyanobacterium]|jgi:K+-transporting ATPase ATPase C chain
MFEEIIPSLKLTLLTFLLCGLAYPLLLTGISQTFFPYQANGSLIKGKDLPLGSALVGQKFVGSAFFQGRVSSIDYKAESSGSSNYGPTNRALFDRIASDSIVLRKENPSIGKRIPVDLLTQSGSGLDPDITPASALIQVPRVAKARGMREEEVRRLVDRNTENPLLFGERRVNVLKLNLALSGFER